MKLILIALFSCAFAALGHLEWSFEKIGKDIKATILVYDNVSNPIEWGTISYDVTDCDESISWNEGDPSTNLYHIFTHEEVTSAYFCDFTHEGGLVYSKIITVQIFFFLTPAQKRRYVTSIDQDFNVKFRVENSTSVYYEAIIYEDITPHDTDDMTLEFEIEVLRIDAIDGDLVPDTPPWVMRKSTTVEPADPDSIVYFRVREPLDETRRGIEIHNDITQWLSHETSDTKVELRTNPDAQGLALELIGATLTPGCIPDLRRKIEANYLCMEGSFYIPGKDVIPYGGEYDYIYFEFTVINTDPIPEERRKVTVIFPLTSSSKNKMRRQIVESPFAIYNAIILGPDGECITCGTLEDIMWAVLIIGIVSLVILILGTLLVGYFMYKRMSNRENYKIVEEEEEMD